MPLTITLTQTKTPSLKKVPYSLHLAAFSIWHPKSNSYFHALSFESQGPLTYVGLSADSLRQTVILKCPDLPPRCSRVEQPEQRPHGPKCQHHLPPGPLKQR